MDKTPLKKGTRIYYTGDQANHEGFGVITHRSTGQYGVFVTVQLDDGRIFESLSLLDFSDTYKGDYSTRFVTAAAYKAWAFRNNNKAFEKMQEDASREAEKRGKSDMKKSTTTKELKKEKRKMLQTKNRTAYFILESQTNDRGEFRALIAVENESGYHKTDWFWGDILNQAEEIARDKNQAMGITKKDANLIILSTMRKGAIEKPKF